MKRIVDLIFVGGFILTIIAAFQKSEKQDTIFFASLNKAIQLGQYDGTMELGELLKHGDFGLGSEEKLKSELLILEGVAYGAMGDGTVRALPNHTPVPFASIKFFVPDTSFRIKGNVSFSELKQLLDSILGPNSFAAVKVNGRFANVQFRSFYKQEKPYRPLKEALFSKFEKKDVEGTALGFFTPKSSEVLNSPVYHFHFIDNAKTTGGHLLDAKIEEADIQIDFSRDLVIRLPKNGMLSNIDLNKPL